MDAPAGDVDCGRALALYTCPECGRPLETVWTDKAGERRPELVTCPHLVDGLECPGMVEVDVPPDTRAVPVLRA